MIESCTAHHRRMARRAAESVGRIHRNRTGPRALRYAVHGTCGSRPACLRENGGMTSAPSITLFGADWCRDCVRTKKQLDTPRRRLRVRGPDRQPGRRRCGARDLRPHPDPGRGVPGREPPRRAVERRRRGEAARARARLTRAAVDARRYRTWRYRVSAGGGIRLSGERCRERPHQRRCAHSPAPCRSHSGHPGPRRAAHRSRRLRRRAGTSGCRGIRFSVCHAHAHPDADAPDPLRAAAGDHRRTRTRAR